jgi:hypothetical protein
MTEHDETDVLRAIREIHAAGGRVLTREETLEFITRPYYLGPPEPLPSGKRGPKTKRTQYDAAYERRKGLFHRLKRLPDSRKLAGDPLRDRVEAAALAELALHPDKPARTLSRRVWLALTKKGFIHDIGTIRRNLKSLGMKNSPG